MLELRIQRVHHLTIFFPSDAALLGLYELRIFPVEYQNAISFHFYCVELSILLTEIGISVN